MVRVTQYGLDDRDWSALEREVVDLFTALLRVDTTNPPGNETACALVLRDYLARNGIESTLVGELPERQNLVARLDGARPGPTLALMGHLDVVPADAAEWSVPPFGGVVKDGYVWGCGATDMKNQVAAEAVALARLKRAGRATSPARSSSRPRPTRRTASSAASAGSAASIPRRSAATTCSTRAWAACGCRWTAARSSCWPPARRPSPSSASARAARGGHASVPEKEHSAVIDLARAVTALGLADPPAIVSPMTAAFIDVVVADAALARAPQGSRARRAPPAPSCAGSTRRSRRWSSPCSAPRSRPRCCRAGKAVNVIPTHAEAYVDCRILPEMTPTATRELVAAVLDPLGIDWEFEWVDVTDAQRLAGADSAQREHRARAARRRA